jgi:hypothetical protein
MTINHRTANQPRCRSTRRRRRWTLALAATAFTATATAAVGSSAGAQPDAAQYRCDLGTGGVTEVFASLHACLADLEAPYSLIAAIPVRAPRS